MADNYDSEIILVDKTLEQWKQGDCAVGTDHWFGYRCNPKMPLSAASRAAAEDGAEYVEEEIIGFVVVTQTCDIVRKCSIRPYVDICPLVQVSDSQLREIRRGRHIALAYLPLLAERRLVADLSRIMTIEKPVLTEYARIPGCDNSQHVRDFARCVARKWGRFAFPDGFQSFVDKLIGLCREKHRKASPEGRAIQALREIRVCGMPSWDSARINVTFWFIRENEDTLFDGREWNQYLSKWLSTLEPNSQFAGVEGKVVSLRWMTGDDYASSVPLDLDYLSTTSEL